jgi:hypothetical protein
MSRGTYFGLDMLCLFEARVSEFDTQTLPWTNVEVYTVLCAVRQILGLKIGGIQYIKPKIQQCHHIS